MVKVEGWRPKSGRAGIGELPAYGQVWAWLVGFEVLERVAALDSVCLAEIAMCAAHCASQMEHVERLR